jgi:multidrug efflux pump
MAGLTPMMLGISLDFFGGGYSIDSPTAMWWKQLATAVVFGLGIATLLTLVVTPALLALRVWLSTGAYRSAAALATLGMGRRSRIARDRALERATARMKAPEILWEEPVMPDRDAVPETLVPETLEPLPEAGDDTPPPVPLRAAE